MWNTKEPVTFDSGSGKIIHCPICLLDFPTSSYLEEKFKDDGALWLSNMVTHYRHEHITSWNKCWGPHGEKYRGKWFGDYETEKARVNERAKRQIIRQCHAYMKVHNITINHLKQLNNTEAKTFQTAYKYLSLFPTNSDFKDSTDTPLFSGIPA